MLDFVYCITPTGIYGKPAVAICSSMGRAEELLREVENMSDGYHVFNIIKVPIDKIHVIMDEKINWQFRLKR